jgi:hypothetical protein
MEQSPSWDANSHSATQEVPCLLRNPFSQCPATGSYPEPYESVYTLPHNFLKIHRILQLITCSAIYVQSKLEAAESSEILVSYHIITRRHDLKLQRSETSQLLLVL